MPEAPENRNIGAVLLELGRINDADIERALEHQRLQGGFFGQALVDLGIVEQEELDFSLAAQANLPYLTPKAEDIDPAVAARVPATWAERHNAIPVLLEDGWLTLVVDSPLKAGLADDLARRTGLSVKLALCSARLVRSAIRAVYKLEPVRKEAKRILSLEAFWILATSPSAPRWGLMVRHNRVIGWIERAGHVERHHLVHNWLGFLDRLLSPPPSQILPPHGRRQWRASVRPDQSPAAVKVTSLSGPGGHELLFESARDESESLVELPAASDLAALRDSVGKGRTVIGVRSPRGGAARDLVTRLPRLLLDADHHSVCLFREGAHAISGDLLVLNFSEDAVDEPMFDLLEQLGLDALGLELSPSSREMWERALSLAPVILLVLTGAPEEAAPPGIDQLLTTTSDAQPRWQLVAD
ncbi:GspE/PulE/PilB domain-containing protein [Wenzhouxiangella sp. EGI_FJ10305]|uniref:GspE/PulE/PilB domain-containing protein n=1 Tax=Wenzhouxiangella sp. EGI_FJ10305 TaxID=3243768 RepID=UPI0035E043B4